MSGEKVICRRVSDGVLINISHTFDLKQIADSGQCFRLTALQDGGYVAVTGMKLVKITPGTNGGYVFHCPMMSSGMYGCPILTCLLTMKHISRRWPETRFCGRRSRQVAAFVS